MRSEILAALNRQTEAIVLARKAAELDAFFRPWALAASLLRARQFDAAIDQRGRGWNWTRAITESLMSWMALIELKECGKKHSRVQTKRW